MGGVGCGVMGGVGCGVGCGVMGGVGCGVMGGVGCVAAIICTASKDGTLTTPSSTSTG